MISLLIMLAASACEHGPSLTVGFVVAYYWWKVIRMVRKMRKSTGRAANFIPTEPLGRALRLLWQPVVLLWIVLPFLAGFGIHKPSIINPLWHELISQWLAAAVAVFALLATRVCWKRMGTSWRMGIDPNEKTSLIITGPYAYVRHPIYALSTLLMLATMVTVPNPLMMIVGVIHLLLLQWEARREEQHLINVHGEIYRDYYKHVGRFLPRGFSGYSSAETRR